MRFFLTILLIFTYNLYANIIEINDNTSSEILTKAKIFIDKSRKNSIEDILKKDNQFVNIHSSIIRYGYSANFNIWIKFTLHNLENKSISKILEFKNPLVTHISFYENNKLMEKEGLLNKSSLRNSINPIFVINLKKNETKTFYIKAFSKKTALSAKLNLYTNKDFYSQEIFHQVVLGLFFGAMIILALYNFSIFLMIKDTSYLYYIAYITTLVFHHLLYVGFANLYFFTSSQMSIMVDFAAVFIALPVFFLAFFLKSFLETKQYVKINLLLNILIILLVLSVIFFCFSKHFLYYRNVMPIVLMSYLFIITLYSFWKNNSQAKLILFGWFAIFFAGLIMYLSTSGILNIYLSSYYVIEISFVLEAILFSMALANKIKTLEEEKEILLKELTHRVKNNMQTIISLISLQNDKIEDEKINDLLTTIQNRITAMCYLYELLYQKKLKVYISANEYFERIIYEIKQCFNKDIKINSKITATINSESAIYCGLIINELVTNSFKHAFKNKKGQIDIFFYMKNNHYYLIYKDNGKGYTQNMNNESLGLILIQTLSEKQLKAKLEIDSKDGVFVKIKWEKH